MSHYVIMKFYKNSPCQMQKSVSLCGCEIWRRRKSAPKNWLCLTFTVWNAKICLTVWLCLTFCLTFTMWNANCLIVHMTVNLTVWMWNCSLSPLAISILLSATINHGSGWFAQFCSRLLMVVNNYQWKLSPKVIIYFQIWPFGIFKVGAIGIFPNWWTKVLIRNNKTCTPVTFSSVSVE